MCTQVLLGRSKCPKNRPELCQNPVFQEEHAKLLSGTSIAELPEVARQFEQCFSCEHFDPKSPPASAAN